MWNLISGNKIIDRKLKQEAHRKHIRALHCIKPSIDNKSPSEYSFLYSRPKATLLKQERQTDIQNHNTILVQRMMHSSSIIRPRRSVQIKDSLNAPYRSRLERQIDNGNQKLVRRLQSAKSQYHTTGKSLREYSKYKQNLAFSRMDPFYDYDTHQQPASVPPKPGRPFSAKR